MLFGGGRTQCFDARRKDIVQPRSSTIVETTGPDDIDGGMPGIDGTEDSLPLSAFEYFRQNMVDRRKSDLFIEGPMILYRLEEQHCGNARITRGQFQNALDNLFQSQARRNIRSGKLL